MDHKYKRLADIEALVAPKDYQNPKPKKKYDLLVIGGGTAGLIAALGAHALGAKVALVESTHMGGDCLNTGCVPSKGLIEVAKQYHQAQTFLGLHGQCLDMDTASWIEHGQAARAKIAPHDAVARFVEMGLDVFLAKAQFAGQHEVTLSTGENLCFAKAAICSGASPRVLHIDGLSTADVLTSESIFDLSALPEKMLVIGSGPIGCELAQACVRLGVEVKMVTQDQKLFVNSEAQTSQKMHEVFTEEGIKMHFDAQVQKVTKSGSEKTALILSKHEELEIAFDKVLIAVGRAPNTNSLQLDRAGVAFDHQGIKVDAYLRTSVKHIFASGDVTGRAMFTHHADAQSRVLVQNAFTPLKKKAQFTVPMVTYTQPEVASVFADQVSKAAPGIKKISLQFADVDRSIIKGESGFAIHVYIDAKERIQGAEIIHPLAGEILPQVQLAMHHKMKLSDFSSMIYAYPTESEILRKMGDQQRAKKFTPHLQKISKLMVRWL